MGKKNWQGDVRESAHKIWLAGLGALAVTEEEGSKLFKNLVQQGERYEAQGKQRLKEVKKDADEVGARAKKVAEETADRARRAAEGAWEQLGGAFDDKLAKALHRIGVPTREEINGLSRRIEELTHAVERARAPKPAPKPTPRPAVKPAAKPSGGARPRPASASAVKKPARAGASGPPPAPDIATTKDVVTTTADVITKP
ncbi:MAG TPA: phasin family protein [Thermoanaerobaculia bacterium]|jgi:poly(hydroxyalkanoate) granule-associated protein|nr:phasin family protein [Thermoanaerobaculia bacterium]